MSAMLAGKIAVIYGGGGAIGGAAARAFAREGARVFLAGRTRARLEAVAREIARNGGGAEIAEVDALDEPAVAAHADAVAATGNGIDIALNAVGIPHVQGVPVAELALADFAHPIHAYTRTHFITAKAVARHMAAKRSGVILLMSTPGAYLPGVGYLGYGVACAAKEALSRLLCRRARAQRHPGGLLAAACRSASHDGRLAQPGRVPPRRRARRSHRGADAGRGGRGNAAETAADPR
jgi:3-oxoacyl-[acyl-carrier protein] reductase